MEMIREMEKIVKGFLLGKVAIKPDKMDKFLNILNDYGMKWGSGHPANDAFMCRMCSEDHFIALVEGEMSYVVESQMDYLLDKGFLDNACLMDGDWEEDFHNMIGYFNAYPELLYDEDEDEDEDEEEDEEEDDEDCDECECEDCDHWLLCTLLNGVK